MTKVKWKELKKEIQDKNTWNDTLYKEKNGKRIQLTNFGFASWRVLYNDGSTVEDSLDHGKGLYKDLKRKNVKSISLISQEGKILHTVNVVNDKFLMCLRSVVRPNRDNVGFDNPKRCFIMATEGEVDFVWDDGDIDEMTEFGDEEPYTRPTGGVFDIW